MWPFDEPYPVKRRVLVNTKTDKAFRGVLWQRTGGYLVLRNAELLEPRRDPVLMDGEVVLERGNVDFLQVLGA